MVRDVKYSQDDSMHERKISDFLIIGAAKAATTTLAGMLNQHPNEYSIDIFADITHILNIHLQKIGPAEF